MGEEVKEKKELSHEELKNVANQLQQQNKFLIEQLKKQQEEGFYKRLDYLFKVVEFPQLFLKSDEDFVMKCVNEIVDTITIPDETKSTEEPLDTKQSK